VDVLTEFAKATGVNCGPGEMCLIDWFAGQALIATPGMPEPREEYAAEVAKSRAAEAYTLACAMMDEREATLAEIRGQVKAKCEAANAAERKVYEEQKAARKALLEQEAAEAA
jgi:hypothetical protein